MSGQTVDRVVADTTWRSYGLEEGLPTRIVRSLTYDSTGMMWLCTPSGLFRCNGTAFTPFQQRTLAWRGKIIRAPDQLLYSTVYTHPDSLAIYNPYEHRLSGLDLRRYGSGPFVPLRMIEGAYPTVARGKEIFACRAGSVRQLHRLTESVTSADRLVFADSSGYAIFRADCSEVEILTAGRARRIPLPFSLTTKFYQDPNILLNVLPRHYVFFHYDQAGRLWMASDRGLFVCGAEETSFRAYRAPAGEGNYTFVEEDRAGNLILGHLDYNDDRFYSLRLLTPAGETRDLSFILRGERRIIGFQGADFRQRIDVASYGGAHIISFPQNREVRFHRYLSSSDLEPGDFGHIIRGFAADTAGRVYVNKDSYDPYWFRMEAGQERIDTLRISDGRQQAVNQHGCGTNLLEIRGDIYGQNCVRGIQDTGHLYRYSPATERWDRWLVPDYGQVIRYTVPAPDSQSLYLICEDRAEQRGQIYRFWLDNERLESVRMTDGSVPLRGYPKHALYAPQTGEYFIASTEGLYRFNPLENHLTRSIISDGAATNLSSLLLRPDGQLFVGTLGRGILRYDPGQDSFHTVGGLPTDLEATDPDYLTLPSDNVAALAEREGLLVVTTFNGLVTVGQNGKRVFTRLDGLPDNEFNTPSLFYHAADRTWWAGGINGLISFRAAGVTARSSPHTPVIYGYSWLAEDGPGHEEGYDLFNDAENALTITPNISYFNLHYTIPDYSGLLQPSYETRLLGYDPRWRVSNTQNSVRYTRLPAGRYEFQLRATDAHGRPAPVIATYRIVVLKPWYKRTWFRLLLSAVIFLAVYYLIRRRIRRLQEINATERAMHELELRNVRQQINPHFISNAALAIRRYIEKREPSEAARYLDDFALLMRGFLEASRNHFTPLDQEIELLNHYVRLERMRFPGVFDFEMHVDPELDPAMDEVPSLLLQPIVENAINHGLVPMGTGGLLRIEFLLDEQDVLFIRITDNGIGCRAAAKRNRNRQHISRATEILEDRRALMASSHQLKISVTTEDLYPGHERTGTVVTLRLEAITV